jgi:hypothetical protein
MLFARKAFETVGSRLIGNAKYALVFALVCSACSPIRGCAESSFVLAPESRLPKWFSPPPNMKRSDMTVEMTYYISLLGEERRTARFVLRDSAGRRLADVEGKEQGDHPLTLEPAPLTGPLPYPSYEIVKIDGITEVIEHRQFDHFFFITDDPTVKAKLGVAVP